MGVHSLAMETLAERASFMRESLHKSQTITDNMVAILGSFDHRLSALETAMRPTQALSLSLSLTLTLMKEFTYIRTHSIRRAHENIDKTLKAAEFILARFDLSRQAEATILRGPHEDLESYLEAVDQLRSIVSFFSGNKSLKSSIGVVNHANNLLGKAILKLEEEFRQLLTSYSKPVEPDRFFDCLPNSLRPSAGSPGQGDASGKHQNKSLETVVYHPPTLIPPRILPLLHDLAQQMVQAGFQQQLFNIYRETRISVVEQSLRKLGVEKLGKDDVQKMQWEVLEAKIGNWIHFMRIAVKLLFAGEKKVSDQIFDGYESLRDQCFAEVTANSVAMLLSFGEAIAKSKRSPEKLFVLLDMYEIMRELRSEIDLIFGNKYCAEMRESAVVLTKRLAQTAQETFGDFEEAVEKDATKTAVLDGTVHPLTSYVINYVKFLYDYQSTLKQLFQEFDGDDADAQLASVTTRIMQALQTNLDGKSKQYRDPALTQLFLMNNIHYIVRSVRRSEAKDLLGDDWVQIHRRIVQQHANQYKRISWSKEFDGDDADAQLASVTTRIMQALQTNLDGKSKQYRDPALTQLFLMNNIHYIVRSVRRSEAKDLLGDDWVQIHRRIVQQHANQYKRISWSKILQSLSIQGLSSSGGSGSFGADGGSSGGVSRAMVKDRFKSFNIIFEELHQRQSQWTVPDSELRESLRLAVAEVLLPAYRSFVRRFGSMIENGKNPQKYIRFSPEDLERMLAEFFEGKTLNEPKR
ncbi:unnamed protein product [Ilex paraguariensis]|uniref:Exocyst subunit Exo70 family protein n=1 Tax=Ilex paraguariensis TaxID=185542 RepID=A0ABC8S7V3_9AQUA